MQNRFSNYNASIPAVVVLTKEKNDFKFETNVQPLRLSKWNEKDNITFSMKENTLIMNANEAFLNKFCSFEGLSSSYVEKEFWRKMARGEKGTVEYGINIKGNVFSCDPDNKLGKSKWNLENFSLLPQSTLSLVDKEIPVRKCHRYFDVPRLLQRLLCSLHVV
ncbi:hypothetical protein RJT34_31706 [Clitoria ternatea]|uniref:Uncharacterized protein n=1 Tax=Clitoria ternatea TaxID=43366 RepID=A0AAN9EV45_CLITE